MKTKNIKSLSAVDISTSLAKILDIVAADGGVIIKNFLDTDQIERFNSEVESPMKDLSPGSKHDHELIAEFHGKNTKRLTNLVNHSTTFRQEILEHELVHNLCDAIFIEESGTYWMTTAQLIEIGPNSDAQMLHRDLENWYPFVGMGPNGPEVAVNFMVALTDFTEENGATRVIPGSHLWDNFNDRGHPEDTIPVKMDAGDAFFYTGKVVHGGGANVTSENYRKGLAFAFNPGFLTGEEAYPFLIDIDTAAQLSPRVQRILGFRSQFPVGSAGLWQVDYSELAEYLKLS